MGVDQTLKLGWWWYNTGYNCKVVIQANPKLNGKISMKIL